MKIEIMVTRHSVLRTLMAALLVIFLILLFSTPFYRYGKETSVFTKESGAEEMLIGSWKIQNEKDGQLGVTKIDIASKKAMTATRIIDGQPVTEEGKLSYKEKTGVLKLTFADKSVTEATFQPQLTMDSVKTAALIGYAAYPYECEELTDELKAFFASRNSEYGFQNAVIPSVILLLLTILTIVLVLVWHKKTKGAITAIVIPLAAILMLWLVPAFQFAMTGARVFMSIWLFCVMVASALDLMSLSK